MKKLAACILDFLQLLAIAFPVIGFTLLRWTFLAVDKIVNALEKLREKLKLEAVDAPAWVERLEAWMLKRIE